MHGGADAYSQAVAGISRVASHEGSKSLRQGSRHPSVVIRGWRDRNLVAGGVDCRAFQDDRNLVVAGAAEAIGGQPRGRRGST